MTIAAIRMTGKVGVNPDIKTAFQRLGMLKKYACVLIQENDSTKGMIVQLENFMSYGKIDKEMLKELLIKRGRMPGDNPIKGDAGKMADEILAGKSLKELGLKPFFRLHPARGGIVTKHHYPRGVLGNNKEDFAKLLGRML